MSQNPATPPGALLQAIVDYPSAQVVHAAARLGLADLLADGPRSVDDLAAATGTHAPSLARLVRALAALGALAEVGGGRVELTPLGAPLRSDVPGSVRDAVLFLAGEWYWRAWGGLLHSVRTGEPAFPAVHGTTAWDYRARHPEEGAIFDAAMTGISGMAADAVARSYDFSRIGVLADVGGGHGELLAAILAAHPSMRGILFDQPQVVAGARRLLERAGVADRCEVVGGSFFEAVPGGADAYLLKSVIHDWDDPEAAAILRACRAAVGDKGRLLVVERVVGPPNEPDPAKFSDLNMLVELGGRERTAEEYRDLLAGAGFRLVGVTPTGSPFEVVEAAPV